MTPRNVPVEVTVETLAAALRVLGIPDAVTDIETLHIDHRGIDVTFYRYNDKGQVVAAGGEVATESYRIGIKPVVRGGAK